MSPGPHRALVVDAEAAIGRLTVAALASHGFDCDVANDARRPMKTRGGDIRRHYRRPEDSRPPDKPLAIELIELESGPTSSSTPIASSRSWHRS